MAIRKKENPCIEVLTDNGADVNATDKDGRTVLDLIVLNKDEGYGSWLSGMGAKCATQEYPW